MKTFSNEFSQCIEVHFASLLSGGFTPMVEINPQEKKLDNSTSVQCGGNDLILSI